MHVSVLCSSAHIMCSAVQCNAVVKQCSALHCINLLCWTLSATLARSCSTHFPYPSPSVGSFRKCTARKQEPLELVLPDPSLHCLTFPLAVGQDPLWTKKNILVIHIGIFNIILSKRESLLCGPNSRSCRVLWPSAVAFSTLHVKKVPFQAILV